jgi:hypothetical protein
VARAAPLLDHGPRSSALPRSTCTCTAFPLRTSPPSWPGARTGRADPGR